MNKKLIQQLADGEILLENYNSFGEISRENIRKIIKLAFPKSSYVPLGDAKYYGRFNYSSCQWASYFPNLLVKQVPLSEFLKDDFVLPEYWCIKNTKENVELLEIWSKKYPGTLGSDGEIQISGYSRWDGIWMPQNNTNYTEITLEQFKEHVLKQETKVMKDRLITYKQAQQIVDIACSDWKPKLAKAWAYDIVVKDYAIKVDEEFYQKMRKACTDSQHKVFDEIFGKDVKQFTSDQLKIGQMMRITENCNNKGNILLRTFDCLVSLKNPKDTWVESCAFEGELIPAGTEITIVAK